MPTNSEYQDVRCDGNMSKERGQGNMGAGGEYQGQSGPVSPLDSPVAEGNYPSPFGYSYDPENRMFSQDKEGDPIKLMESTRPGIDAHADLMQAYGLNQPIATLGSHPFLRDELANPGEPEPGNAEPFADAKIPKRR